MRQPSDLKKPNGQFAVNVHKSAAEANIYVACGDLSTLTRAGGINGGTVAAGGTVGAGGTVAARGTVEAGGTVPTCALGAVDPAAGG